MQPIEKKGLSIVLFNLLIVATAGLILRAFRYTTVPFLDYSNFMEAHSHFAFGGWGFMALFICFYHAFPDKRKIKNKTYSFIFFAALFSVWGMFFSFPFRGYAAVSTSFSTLYIWVTYWFAVRFYRDTVGGNRRFSLKLARAALFFLVFSSLGPYTMGALMASGYGGRPEAMNAIYFYLHFQYNGWFIFGMLALFFNWLEKNQISFSKRRALWFYRLLFWSCLPAFLLSVLWSKPPAFVFIIAGLAGLIQLFALVPLFQLLYKCRKEIRACSHPVVYATGVLVFIFLTLKYLFQFLGAFPDIVRMTVSNRNLIIAYLHLVFLGVYTLFILAYYIQERMLLFHKVTGTGLWLFLTGFILTEILLFGQSGLRLLNLYIPSFSSWMFYTTIPLWLGPVLLWTGHFRIVFSALFEKKKCTSGVTAHQSLATAEPGSQPA